MAASYVRNPLTGRSIRVGGATWKSLLKQHDDQPLRQLGYERQRAPKQQQQQQGRTAGCGACRPRTAGQRLKRVRHPLMRHNRGRKGPAESATDFALGTLMMGKDGKMWHIIKSGKTRRWARL